MPERPCSRRWPRRAPCSPPGATAITRCVRIQRLTTGRRKNSGPIIWPLPRRPERTKTSVPGLSLGLEERRVLGHADASELKRYAAELDSEVLSRAQFTSALMVSSGWSLYKIGIINSEKLWPRPDAQVAARLPYELGQCLCSAGTYGIYPHELKHMRTHVCLFALNTFPTDYCESERNEEDEAGISAATRNAGRQKRGQCRGARASERERCFSYPGCHQVHSFRSRGTPRVRLSLRLQ